ncbi:MAG: rhomboid family intramembrane serine protease [Candidatus Competibacterales bacterium]
MLLPLHDRNPLKIIPYQAVTLGLIALNAAIFLWQLTLSETALLETLLGFGLVPAALFGAADGSQFDGGPPAWLTLVSYMFFHGGLLHLLGNMLYLWIFGDNIEDSMGHGRFVVFFLLCGIAAGLVHGAIDPAANYPTIGASGAVSGVLGAYLVLHPRVKILVLALGFFALRLPAYLVLLVWLVIQLFNVVAGTPGVAWWAHIGGFLAGALLVIPLRHKHIPLFDRGVEH